MEGGGTIKYHSLNPLVHHDIMVPRGMRGDLIIRRGAKLAVKNGRNCKKMYSFRFLNILLMLIQGLFPM